MILLRYLSGEKKKLDDMTDFGSNSDGAQLDYLTKLRAELESLREKGTLDGYCLYLYGVVLKKLSLADDSKKVLLEAVRLEPCHWGAWLELAT